jgi:toxin ParE1/3/4
MFVEVAWRAGARQDLLDIYVRIGFDNPDAAERFYTTMEARADMLAQHPRLGPRRPDIQPAARLLVEGPYLLLYQTIPDSDDGPIERVEIVRVVDGRRDLTRLF